MFVTQGIMVKKQTQEKKLFHTFLTLFHAIIPSSKKLETFPFIFIFFI